MALDLTAIAALELIVNASTPTPTLLAETPSKGLPIENEYLVLSSNREGADEAYLEIDLDDEITMLEFDAGLWGDMEGNLNNLSFSIQVEKNGNWVDYVTYDLSDFSEYRDTLSRYRVLPPDETAKFRFYSTCANPSGDRNKGRIVLDNLTFKGTF